MRTNRIRWAGAVALAVGLAPLAGAVARADVTEPETGITFPETIDGAGVTLKVCGAGVREKGMVDVYAAALYVERSVLAAKFQSYKGTRDGKALAGGDFYHDFIYTDMRRALVLHVVRDVAASSMRDALDTGLRASMTLDDQARSFVALLDRDLADGDELSFVWSEGWKVEMRLNGKPLGDPVESKAVCTSLLKIWFGSDPISESIKVGCAEWIPHYLKH